MVDNKKPLDNLTVAAIALIILAVLYFAYNLAMGFKAPAPSFNYSLGQFKTVNTATIEAIKSLNACGSWPLAAAGSPARGNPFSRKRSALPQMAATSSPLCMPVTQ